MAADGYHLGQHVAAHADPQGQRKLSLDARGRLRGRGVDKHRGALRFRATRDNRGDNTAFPAFALAVDKIKTFMMNTVTLPFFAAPSTSTATSCAKSLPSFAAPNASSTTSCAKSFTCVFQVPSKGTRVFGVGSELADDDGQASSTSSDQHARIGRVGPRAAWGRHACAGRVGKLDGEVCV